MDGFPVPIVGGREGVGTNELELSRLGNRGTGDRPSGLHRRTRDHATPRATSPFGPRVTTPHHDGRFPRVTRLLPGGPREVSRRGAPRTEPRWLFRRPNF